ncbi:MAG: hypothetical protein RSC73_03860 [Ruthenibacterium sp.]
MMLFTVCETAINNTFRNIDRVFEPLVIFCKKKRLLSRINSIEQTLIEFITGFLIVAPIAMPLMQAFLSFNLKTLR